MATMKYDGGSARDALPAKPKAQPVKAEVKPKKSAGLPSVKKSAPKKSGRIVHATKPVERYTKNMAEKKPVSSKAKTKPPTRGGRVPLDNASSYSTRRLYRGDDGTE